MSDNELANPAAVATPPTIFRETALQRLSSPEQLDQLIRVTSPRTWIAVVAFLSLVVVALLWSIIGTVPLRVSATGVLADREGRLFPATAQASGMIKQVLVKSGDRVKTGQVIATLDVADLEEQLAAARSLLDTLSGQRRSLDDAHRAQRVARRKADDSRAKALNQRIEAGEAYASTLRAELVELGGGAAREDVAARAAAARRSLYDVTRDVATARSELAALQGDDVAFHGVARDRLAELDLKIIAQQGVVEDLSTRLQRTASVRSPADGVVVEVSDAVGTVATPGGRIAIITTMVRETDAIVFLHADSRQRVAPGMTALIVPAGVARAEYGAIIGKVHSVDAYPSDRQTIAAVVQDAALAESISRRGLAYAARIDLMEAPATPSGVAWSASLGPPYAVALGTPATVFIDIKHEHPVALIVPGWASSSATEGAIHGRPSRMKLPFEALRSRRVRTPTLLQMEIAECGAAALGIVQRYYGLYLPLEELREACGVSRDGSKAGNVARAARRYGMTAQGRRLSLEALEKETFPLIVFWDFNHFLVVEGFSRDRVYLNDPAFGPRSVTRSEFDAGFTGVVLDVRPGPDFQRGGSPPRIISSLLHRLEGAHSGLLMVVLSTLGLVIPGIAIPGLTRIFIDDYLQRHETDWIGPLLLATGVAAVLSMVFTWLQQTALLRLQTRLSVVGSAQFLWHVLRLPVAFFTQRYAGDIGIRVQANDRVARLVSGDFGTGLVNVATVAFYAAVMLATDWVLALIGIGITLVNVVAVTSISRRMVAGATRLQQEEGKVMMAAMNGLLTIETIKATGQEDDFFARWAGYHARARNSQLQLSLSNQALAILPVLMGAVSVALVLGIGGIRVAGGALSVGTLIAFLLLLMNFASPIRQLVQSSDAMQKIQGDLVRLDDVLRQGVDARFAPRGNDAASGPPEQKLAGFVELRNISFGYSRLDPPFIDGFSLSLRPGARMALVGATGGGKSTIVNLLLGLYRPWSGEILFDGKPMDAHPARVLERSIAVVSQDVHLFDGTIRDNLTMWDASISEDRVMRAARDACVLDDIAARPGGLDGTIQEGGRNFSGGQRQRLEIARSLARDPAILILDEATAALDPVTELEIDDALRRRGCTCIIVAHRLSTIRDADEIIVIAGGRIVERGTHENLRDVGGVYAALTGTE